MYRRKYAVLLIFILILQAILIFNGCEKKPAKFKCKDALGCVDLRMDEPIKIGILQALSGKVAALGQEQIRGFELALDDRQGKILNRTVTFQIEDTGCTAEGGVNAALKIIADPKYIAIFGTTCSGAAATVSKAMSDAGLTMISGNNSAAFLTSITGKHAPNWQKGYFRTAQNEENSGKAAAIYAYKELGIRKVATINDGDIYTKGLTDGFNKAFSSLGGIVVLDTSINKEDKEMRPVLTAVLNAKAQLLFFPLFQPEANHILFQARTILEFNKIKLMGGGALINNSFLKDSDEKAKGMYFVGPVSCEGPAVDLMGKKYKNKYQTSPSVFYFLYAYDAASILFEAIEKTAFKDDKGILHIGRKALRDGLYATTDFKGISGILSCDQFGDCARPKFNVVQLKDISLGLEGLKTNVKFIYSPKK